MRFTPLSEDTLSAARLDLFSYNGRGNREIYAQQDDGGQDNRHDEQYRFADTTPYAMPSMTSALP